MPNYFAIDKTLRLGEIRLHYRDWGGRGRSVLLLHGLSSTAHIWDLVAPLLVDQARVIALDLRGHGLSDKPDGDYSFETVGGDVFDTVAALRLDHPVIVGHSWGAHVGLWAAARDHELAAGLVLIDGGLGGLDGMTWEQTLERLSPPRLGGMPVDEFRARLVESAPQGLISPAVEAAILANFEIDPENRIHRRLPRELHLRILRAIWETPPAPLYEQIVCPVLIMPCRRAGDGEPDLLARKEAGAALAQEKLVDVEVMWLEDTVHDAPLQRPHRIAEAITGFLNERI